MLTAKILIEVNLLSFSFPPMTQHDRPPTRNSVPASPMVDDLCIVQRTSDDLLVTNLGSEQVLLDVDRGEYFGLNPSGRYLFSLIDEPKRVKELADTLVVQFDIPFDVAIADVRSFVVEMGRLGLLSISPPSQAVPPALGTP